MDRVEGWIKLHRKLQEKAIWQCATPEQKAILITILLNINSDKKEWEWQGKQFTCEPGQMVTSLASLAEKCGKGVSIKNVRTALEKFEKYGFLTNQSAKTGRLITVVNWAFYQDSSYEVANQSANSRQKKIFHSIFGRNGSVWGVRAWKEKQSFFIINLANRYLLSLYGA